MIDKNCKRFAEKIKEYRIKKGLTKSRLSELIGCDMSYVGKFESGKKFPNLKMIFRIAEALEISAKDLFDFE